MSSFAEPIGLNERQLANAGWSPLEAFRPLPLLRNRHIQTLLGHLLRGPAVRHASVPQLVKLADGDALVLHDSVPEGWKPGEPIAVVVHGLTGSHASPQVQRMAVGLLKHDLRVVRLDLRGCGQGLPLARGFYHGGCSDDVRTALAEVHRWAPASPLLLIGVSLGGNIVLKLAGEAAEHPVRGLARVAALAPPIDLEGCVQLLSQRANRLYEKLFVRDLMREAEQRQCHFPDLPPLRWAKRMTMRLFDDLYTAPRRGFADSTDYYRRASAQPYIPRIDVPTLIMAAADDPFVAVEPIRSLKVPDHITVRIYPNGGHLGFVGWDGCGGYRWAERRMLEWTLQKW